MVILIETAMIAPPVVTKLFAGHSIRGKGQLHDVMVGSAPFVLTMFIMLVLVWVFLQCVMWLPGIAR